MSSSPYLEEAGQLVGESWPSAQPVSRVEQGDSGPFEDSEAFEGFGEFDDYALLYPDEDEVFEVAADDGDDAELGAEWADYEDYGVSAGEVESGYDDGDEEVAAQLDEFDGHELEVEDELQLLDTPYQAEVSIGSPGIHLAPAEEQFIGRWAEGALVLLAVARGERGPSRLTDLVFHRRHPDRGGRPISRSEPGASRLVREWKTIRSTIVLPALAGIGSSRPVVSRPQGTQPGIGQKNWSVIREHAAQIALAEWRRWQNGRAIETDSAMEAIIRNDYWLGSVGWLPKLKPGQRISGPAWSAAFVSWVYGKAGASPEFRPRGAHWRYVRDALDGPAGHPVQAVLPNRMAPRVGDVVVGWRKRPTNLQVIATASLGSAIPTHGDIVVDVKPGKILVVGGNVSNSAYPRRGVTVNRRQRRTGANGHWSSSKAVAVLRMGP